MWVSEITPMTRGGVNDRSDARLNASGKTTNSRFGQRLPHIVRVALGERPQRRPRRSALEPYSFHGHLQARYAVFGRHRRIWREHSELELPRPLVVSGVEATLDFLALGRRDVTECENAAGCTEAKRGIEEIGRAREHGKSVRGSGNHLANFWRVSAGVFDSSNVRMARELAHE